MSVILRSKDLALSVHKTESDPSAACLTDSRRLSVHTSLRMTAREGFCFVSLLSLTSVSVILSELSARKESKDLALSVYKPE